MTVPCATSCHILIILSSVCLINIFAQAQAQVMAISTISGQKCITPHHLEDEQCYPPAGRSHLTPWISSGNVFWLTATAQYSQCATTSRKRTYKECLKISYLRQTCYLNSFTSVGKKQELHFINDSTSQGKSHWAQKTCLPSDRYPSLMLTTCSITWVLYFAGIQVVWT